MNDPSRWSRDVEKVRRFWSGYAEQFDGVYHRRSLVDRLFRQAVPMRQAFALEILDGYSEPTVLDVGCGSGRQMTAAVEAGAACALGIDLSPAMISLGENAAREAGLSDRVEFRIGDIMDLPVTATWDVVWALGVFDYIRDPFPLVQRMTELSRGHVAASFRRVWAARNPLRKLTYALRGCPIYFQTRGQVEGWFREAGLVDITVSRLGPSGYFASGRKAQ